MENKAHWFHLHLRDTTEYTTQSVRQLNRTENAGPAFIECIIKYFLLYFPAFPSCTYKEEWKKEFYPWFSVLLK